MHPPRSHTNKRRHVPASPPLGGGLSLDDHSSNQGFYPGWHPPPSGPAELENQFILRLPKEPAEALREALRSGASNIKERLAIQMEPDKASTNTSYLRKGFVEFDGWSMHTKLMDLPTVIGSYKTIDKKNFYKTADLCQILICKEGEPTDEEEEEPKLKRQDPTKVDKKYRYPHGLTNPMKNCRKRRFRKTLKKKFVEAPEVEKEVKRLFRVDNDAASVKWELVTEEELSMGKGKKDIKEDTSEAPITTDESKVTVEAQDIFGALSDSDDDRPNADVDIDSEGDSNTFDQTDNTKAAPSGPTQFSQEMFPPKTEEKKEKGIVAQKLEKLRVEINQLKQQKIDLENNIAHCDNQVLLQRFQETLNQVIREIDQKVADEESMSMMFS